MKKNLGDDGRLFALGVVSFLGLVAGPLRGSRARLLPQKKRVLGYTVTYERTDEDGETTERGWIQEGGHELDVPDDLYGPAYTKFLEDNGGVLHTLDYDVDEEGDHIAEMVRVLWNDGATETSSVPFSPGSWFIATDSQDMYTGGYEQRSYRLVGFTPDEEREIAKRVTR